MLKTHKINKLNKLHNRSLINLNGILTDLPAVRGGHAVTGPITFQKLISVSVNNCKLPVKEE